MTLTDQPPVITEAMQAESARQLNTAIDQLGATALRIRDERDELAKACRDVLLFHSGSHWTPDVRRYWKELTGEDEATTRTLCNTVRAALKKAAL